MAQKKEFKTQQALCHWLKLQYPSVIFRSDLGGIRLTIGQAKLVKTVQKSRAYPDIFIAEPRNDYHGMFLEVKLEDEKIFKGDGTLYADEHLKEQHEMLNALKEKGYFTCFGLGFDHCKELIIAYLGRPEQYQLR